MSPHYTSSFLLSLPLMLFLPLIIESSDINLPNCGLTGIKAQPKIIGGSDASIEEFPWQVSLQRITLGSLIPVPEWKHLCGGSIINRFWILTAAHCVEGITMAMFPMQIRAVIGTDLWRNTLFQRSVQRIAISEIIVHEEWNRDEGKNDIALVKTSSPIIFGTNNDTKVNSICILTDNTNITGNVMLSGWGMVSDRSILLRGLPNKLQKIEIPIVNMERCRGIYGINDVDITESMICAGSYRNGYCLGAYTGDSGGALVKYIDGRAYQVGIVSFSLPCRQYKAPDVYTKISKFVDWIQNKIKRN